MVPLNNRIIKKIVREMNRTIRLTWNFGFMEGDFKDWNAASESGLPRFPPTNASMPKCLSIWLQMIKQT